MGHLKVAGVVSGLGTFNQNGTGTTELPAAETYSGVTNVYAGTLQVDTSLASSTVHVFTAGALTGAGSITGNASVTGNGVIDLGTNSVIGGTLAVTGGNWDGGGTVTGLITSSGNTFTIGSGATLNANGGLNVTGGQLAGTGTIVGKVTETSGVSSTFGGILSGGSSLTLNMGAAILTLTGANTYTGLTTISSGTLDVEGSLAASSTVNIASGGTLAGNGTVNGSVTVTGNGTINLGATGLIAGSVTSTGGNWKGLGSVTSGVTANSGTFTVNGTLTAPFVTIAGGTLAGTGTIDGDLNYSSATSSTFGGTINAPGNGVNVNSTGTSTLTLTGLVNAAISVNSGTVQIGNGTAGFAPTGVISVTSVVALDLPNGTSVATNIAFNNPTATSAINVIQSGTTTISGSVGGGGVGTFNQNGTGTTILTGVDFAGATKVSKGTLQIGDGATPGAGIDVSAGPVTVAAGATLALNLDSTDVNGLPLSTNVSLGGTTAAVKAIPTSGTTTTVSGVISGTGTFSQNGLGTTVLSGTNTYTGATNVNTGTLEVDGSLAAGSTVNVGTGGTLTGFGIMAGKRDLDWQWDDQSNQWRHHRRNSRRDRRQLERATARFDQA